jgi:hypothetical protein
VFVFYLRTNSDFCHLHNKLIGLYNRVEKCLQRGMNWVYKLSGLRLVCKGLEKQKTQHAGHVSRTRLDGKGEIKR